MNYVSIRFWGLLLVLLLLYGLVRFLFRAKWTSGADRWALLLLSFTLFAAESWLSFLIFIGVGSWIFAASRFIHCETRGRTWLVPAASLVALTPLLFFKYWAPAEGGYLIPIGISFYSFQMIGLLVDSSREPGGARLGARDFFSFAAFFPQIVAGPIERKEGLLPQLQNFVFRYRREDVEQGLRFVVLGLFYKMVLGDNLAEASQWIVSAMGNPWLVHYSNLVFGLRIYFDFCGYSLIAVGLGRVFGVRLTENFRSPYTQRNVQQFWRTWHITLSRWFRDYLYVPLGGNRGRFPALVILIVFVVSGIWHGAGWNFALWGLAHGVYLILFLKTRKWLSLPPLVGWALTFAAAMTAWLFFYQTDSTVLLEKVRLLVSPGSYLENPLPEFARVARSQAMMLYSLATMAMGGAILALEGLMRWRKREFHAWAMSLPVQLVMVVLIVWMAPVGDNGFVYFNF